jgi:hypothetical protein
VGKASGYAINQLFLLKPCDGICSETAARQGYAGWLGSAGGLIDDVAGVRGCVWLAGLFVLFWLIFCLSAAVLFAVIIWRTALSCVRLVEGWLVQEGCCGSC